MVIRNPPLPEAGRVQTDTLDSRMCGQQMPASHNNLRGIVQSNDSFIHQNEAIMPQKVSQDIYSNPKPIHIELHCKVALTLCLIMPPFSQERTDHTASASHDFMMSTVAFEPNIWSLHWV